MSPQFTFYDVTSKTTTAVGTVWLLWKVNASCETHFPSKRMSQSVRLRNLRHAHASRLQTPCRMENLLLLLLLLLHCHSHYYYYYYNANITGNAKQICFKQAIYNK
jgi:hypothetical protein